MALIDDLKNKIDAYFKEPYEVEETTIVPDTDYSKLTFGNKGLTSILCFLFVDIRQSSKLHTTHGFKNAAKIYQSFHDICIRVIESKSGKVRAFDGDRIMGVFAGDRKCSNAVEAGMKIKWAIIEILSPKLKTGIAVGVGIDFGTTLITKVGKGRDPNNNDLVWVGEACNYAAHLSSEGNNTIIISERTYKKIDSNCKVSDKNQEMFKLKILTLKNNIKVNVYETNFGWVIN